MLNAVKINGSNPPMNKPIITFGSVRENWKKCSADIRSRADEVRAQFFDVGTEKHERRQSGRGDGVTFRHRLHRVADGIEFVRHAAHFLRQIAHHRDAARVVRDRAERIERNDDAGHREHAHDRDGDSVKSGEMKAEQNREADETNRQRGRMLSDGETGDDVRRVAGFRGLGDLPNRIVAHRRVIIRDHNHDAGHEQADERCAVKISWRLQHSANRDAIRKKRCVAGQKRIAETNALAPTAPINTVPGLPPLTLTKRIPQIAPSTEMPPSTNG